MKILVFRCASATCSFWNISKQLSSAKSNGLPMFLSHMYNISFIFHCSKIEEEISLYHNVRITHVPFALKIRSRNSDFALGLKTDLCDQSEIRKYFRHKAGPSYCFYLHGFLLHLNIKDKVIECTDFITGHVISFFFLPPLHFPSPVYVSSKNAGCSL